MQPWKCLENQTVVLSWNGIESCIVIAKKRDGVRRGRTIRTYVLLSLGTLKRWNGRERSLRGHLYRP